jgi:LDH2 family malate/lactate/ureidoglycolate dehydrogenase
MTDTAGSGESLEIDLPELVSISRKALAGFISPASAVEEILAQLLDAELRGKRTHGLVRIPWLKERLGTTQHQPPLKHEITPWFSRFECAKSVGYVAAREGSRELQRILQENPFGIVVCAGAFPTGVVGDYLRPLAKTGHLALGFATCPPLVSFAPGEKPQLGTNPIAMAMPFQKEKPAFVADISPAPTTFGQLLSMLFGGDGDLSELSVTTPDGRAPSEVGELFDDRIRLTGQIVQQLETATQRRQYALTVAIELLTTLFAGENPRGALVLVAFDPERLPGLHPQAAADLMERLAERLGMDSMPGAHGEARMNKQKNRGSLSLPRPLWQTLKNMSEIEN